MKSAMTNFDIAAILPELRQHTIGGHIHNVYQISETAFLLKIQPNNENLIIEPAKRIHLTKFEIKTPPKPSQLCMAFRKHLRSARIVDLQQPHFERLVFIDIERQRERGKIVVELLPRGNMILVDDQERVVVSSRYMRMKDRNILRGQQLRLPPQRGKNLLEVNEDDLAQLKAQGSTEAVRAFAQLFGIGGTYVEEILQRAHVDKSTPAETLSDDQIRRIWQAISELKDTITAGPKSPAIVLDDSTIIDVVPFELECYRDLNKRTMTSFSDAVDEYFTHLSSSERAERQEDLYSAKRQQLERRLTAQRNQVEEINRSTGTLRTMGDLIFRHLNQIGTVLDVVAEKKRSKVPLEDIRKSLREASAEAKKPYPYVADLSSRGDQVTFEFDNMQIEVEARRRPQDQAAEYYDKAKRLEAKISGLENSIKETRLLLDKLTVKKAEEERRKIRPEHRREREWFEKFRWFDSSEELLIIGGRDATSNEVLLKRYTSPEDLVMHAEVHGAPFFVVKTRGTQPSPETLMEAAQACVSFSRLWKEGIRSGDAYWVKPDQVTKSAPPGEYLTRGAFMVRGARNYIRGVELALAIGVTTRDGRVLLMAGPPEAVKNKCTTYVEIRQGRGSAAEVSKRILAILEKHVTETTRDELRRIAKDDIIRLLPPGGVEVASSISP